MMDIQAIILAAGYARRMGEPKQLLRIGEKTILEFALEPILSMDFRHVIAVIGNEKDRIKKQIKINDPRFSWVINELFHEGQSTSIKAGIKSLNESPVHVMIFLGDLPFIKKETISVIYQTGLKKLQETGTTFTVRPVYQGVPGHPVFLGNMSETDFDRLKGDQGAKPLMKEITEHIEIEVEDRGILFDIDTPNDYNEAKAMYRRLTGSKAPNSSTRR